MRIKFIQLRMLSILGIHLQFISFLIQEKYSGRQSMQAELLVAFFLEVEVLGMNRNQMLWESLKVDDRQYQTRNFPKATPPFLLLSSCSYYSFFWL